jgi:3-oxoadipate enol-lactonase
MAMARANDGTLLHFQVLGRRGAPPVLLIAGLGQELTGWTLQRLAFASRYCTIALDNRGVGRSDKPAGDYSLIEMADDAVAVLDALRIDSAHVVGLSMGGAISQVLAVRHPGRLRSLTLVCTACRNHPWRRELLEEWAETARRRGMRALSNEAMRWLVGPRSLRRFAPALGLFGPLALQCPPHAFAAQVNAILAASNALAGDLSKIAVPTLVVAGNQDILTPRGDAEELADRIPGAELVVISGAAHGLTVEHASTFNRIVLEFLGRSERAWPTLRTVA